MEIVFCIVSIVATIASCVSSCVYAWLAYKKSKKDELWETAIQLTLHDGMSSDPDTLVDYYNQLRFFKKHPDLVAEENTILAAMNIAKREQQTNL